MESATKTAMRDALGEEQLRAMVEDADEPEGHGPWSRTDMLLASLFDQVAAMRHEAVLVHSKPPGPPAPAAFPRPGVPRVRKKTVDLAAVRYLDEIRERNRKHRESGV